MLREGEVSTMAGSRYVLAEFSESSEGSYIRERLNKLISSGYKPIAAHIERYEPQGQTWASWRNLWIWEYPCRSMQTVL